MLVWGAGSVSWRCLWALPQILLLTLGVRAGSDAVSVGARAAVDGQDQAAFHLEHHSDPHGQQVASAPGVRRAMHGLAGSDCAVLVSARVSALCSELAVCSMSVASGLVSACVVCSALLFVWAHSALLLFLRVVCSGADAARSLIFMFSYLLRWREVNNVRTAVKQIREDVKKQASAPDLAHPNQPRRPRFTALETNEAPRPSGAVQMAADRAEDRVEAEAC